MKWTFLCLCSLPMVGLIACLGAPEDKQPSPSASASGPIATKLTPKTYLPPPVAQPVDYSQLKPLFLPAAYFAEVTIDISGVFEDRLIITDELTNQPVFNQRNYDQNNLGAHFNTRLGPGDGNGSDGVYSIAGWTKRGQPDAGRPWYQAQLNPRTSCLGLAGHPSDNPWWEEPGSCGSIGTRPATMSLSWDDAFKQQYNNIVVTIAYHQ